MLPYDATIKSHKRAKRLCLRISHTGEVIVTKPFFCSRRKAEAFLHAQTEWLEKQFQKMPRRNPNPELPSRIELPALGRSFRITTTPSGRGIVENEGRITLKGSSGDATRELRRLRRHLRGIASDFLGEQTSALAQQMQVEVQRVSIRDQQSRWGSCSRAGAISLNQKLLLLQPELARYVIIHELCHRCEMNHSPRFWELVKKWEPRFRELEKRLSFRNLPDWALVRLT